MPFRKPKSSYADLRASISRSGGASLLDSGRDGGAAVGTDAAPSSSDPSPALLQLVLRHHEYGTSRCRQGESGIHPISTLSD